MTYQIVYGSSFRDDVRDHVAWLRRQKGSEGRIEAWYARLFDHIDTL